MAIFRLVVFDYINEKLNYRKQLCYFSIVDIHYYPLLCFWFSSTFLLRKNSSCITFTIFFIIFYQQFIYQKLKMLTYFIRSNQYEVYYNDIISFQFSYDSCVDKELKTIPMTYITSIEYQKNQTQLLIKVIIQIYASGQEWDIQQEFGFFILEFLGKLNIKIMFITFFKKSSLFFFFLVECQILMIFLFRQIIIIVIIIYQFTNINVGMDYSASKSHSQINNFIKQFHTIPHFQDELLFNLSQSSKVPNTFGPRANYGIATSEVAGHDDARTIVQKLMNTKKYQSARGENMDFDSQQIKIQGFYRLQNTQKKIFNEVINLFDEIQQLKQKITQQEQDILKLQVEKDHLLNFKASGKNMYQIDTLINLIKKKEKNNAEKGQQRDIRMSYVQLDKIKQENEQILRKIKAIQSKRTGDFQELLNIQKDKYRALERRFNQKKQQIKQKGKIDPEQILKLKQKIIQLTQINHDLQQHSKATDLQQQLNRLKDDNEILRKKAICLLATEKNTYDRRDQERRKLQQYIRQQEQNKKMFLEDLRKFKTQFNRLKDQNSKLKKKYKEKFGQSYHTEEPQQGQLLNQANEMKSQKLGHIQNSQPHAVGSETSLQHQNQNIKNASRVSSQKGNIFSVRNEDFSRAKKLY